MSGDEFELISNVESEQIKKEKYITSNQNNNKLRKPGNDNTSLHKGTL